MVVSLSRWRQFNWFWFVCLDVFVCFLVFFNAGFSIPGFDFPNVLVHFSRFCLFSRFLFAVDVFSHFFFLPFPFPFFFYRLSISFNFIFVNVSLNLLSLLSLIFGKERAKWKWKWGERRFFKGKWKWFWQIRKIRFLLKRGIIVRNLKKKKGRGRNRMWEMRVREGR